MSNSKSIDAESLIEMVRYVPNIALERLRDEIKTLIRLDDLSREDYRRLLRKLLWDT
ncbi:hypothetical protein LCGC14_1289770 [marine sediment metagenome]|uniref:Uncharacterized protein n=1 Tax=marine sediment metagenome TaxID=412755 RepID=A0A0F9N9E8_9ZZZZ